MTMPFWSSPRLLSKPVARAILPWVPFSFFLSSCVRSRISFVCVSWRRRVNSRALSPLFPTELNFRRFARIRGSLFDSFQRRKRRRSKRKVSRTKLDEMDYSFKRVVSGSDFFVFFVFLRAFSAVNLSIFYCRISLLLFFLSFLAFLGSERNRHKSSHHAINSHVFFPTPPTFTRSFPRPTHERVGLFRISRSLFSLSSPPRSFRRTGAVSRVVKEERILYI